jgi:hypothetical protein
MEGYQSLSPVMKGFVTGLAVAIPVIATVTTAVITLTAAFHALKIAINPVAGVIGLVVGAVAGLGFAYAATEVANQAAMDTQDQYQEAVERTSLSVDQLIEKHREISFSIDYVEAKRRLREIHKEIDQYNNTLKQMETGLVIVGADYWDRHRERLIEKQQLEARIAADDAEARRQFNKERSRIETEATMTGIALLEYKLAYERQHYRELGAVTAENADEQISTLQRIKNLESSLNQARQKELDSLSQMQQRYNLLVIEDAIERKLRELEIQRDGELAKAQALGASEETLANIRRYFANEATRIEQDGIATRNRLLEAEARDRERIVSEERNRLQEIADTRIEFQRRHLDLMGMTWDAELMAIDNYYARRKEKLLAAGFTEEQITQQSEMAKARIREQYEMRHLQGAQQILRDLAKTSEIFGKKGFAMWKTLSIGSAMIDTYAAATAAYKAMVGIPVVGPGLAVTAAAAAIGAGLANVAAIQATEPPKAESGGILIGRSHNEGGILIEAEGDEYITAKDRVRALGRGFFDFLNFAPLEKVKLAFAGMPVPSVPIPSNIGSYYASGGSISSGGAMNTLLEIMASMRDEIISLKQTVMESKPMIDIHVDPLSNDPVKVSEIADKGKMIRSEV